MSRKTAIQREHVFSTSTSLDTKSPPDVGWRDKKTAEQCLSHLCLSERLSDIRFTFSDDKQVVFPAHKFVLSMRSAVFEAMFYGSLAEKGDTVLIEDVDPEAMEVILRFIYSDKPKIDGRNVLRCLYAAKKYALMGLVQQCSSFLERNIDTSNVCSIHEHAVFYDMNSLQTKCFDYILNNATEVLKSPGFLKVSHSTLFNLLKSDELSEDEVDVFKAALHWSKNNCEDNNQPTDALKLRKCLGNALFAIRFPIMPIEKFAMAVATTGILTSEELIMLYQFNATNGSSPLVKFINRERSVPTVKVNVTKRIQTQYQANKSGYVLQIRNQYDYNGDPLPNDRPFVKVESVSGTFVKNVKKITVGNIPVTDYRNVGNKITFKSPIETSDDNPIQFYPTRKRSYELERDIDCRSYRTSIQAEVNGRSISIVKVPVGLETVSFAKC
ncbi:BTB/POZ domain-containing protein 2-like [Mercenaria mercenaria]|uniref:BTB/POZ domain-containing protein 2-like n=1 Tax=Mercenaria mercenaria TaxID=6596 RepID=UPI00234F82A3|nr:BTB/POZ domain-containing protein 2-like [Mercenaria mercenaria]